MRFRKADKHLTFNIYDPTGIRLLTGPSLDFGQKFQNNFGILWVPYATAVMK